MGTAISPEAKMDGDWRRWHRRDTKKLYLIGTLSTALKRSAVGIWQQLHCPNPCCSCPQFYDERATTSAGHKETNTDLRAFEYVKGFTKCTKNLHSFRLTWDCQCFRTMLASRRCDCHNESLERWQRIVSRLGDNNKNNRA